MKVLENHILESDMPLENNKNMDYKQTSEEIIDWIKTYALDNKRRSLVVGVSGGVDSALVSTLCAMTQLQTYCVLMPCQTKINETNRGSVHIKWLQEKYSNVHCEKVDLTSTFESFQKETINYNNSLGYANSKSRLRMITLYQIAASVDGLVVGTGNKVEDFGVGFFTKYGDGGVDISPISDLLKSDVRKMCRELGVLPELSEAIPTDGLWNDARTDETQIGATYDELEWAMAFFESDRLSILETEISSRQREVLNIYAKFNRQNKHKMIPIPMFNSKKKKINS